MTRMVPSICLKCLHCMCENACIVCIHDAGTGTGNALCKMSWFDVFCHDFSNMKLSLHDRRFIASKFQEANWTEKQLCVHGFSRTAIRRWCRVPCNDPDSSFVDVARSGRPKVFFRSVAQAKDMVRSTLESDGGNVVQTAADKENCSPSTIRRAAHTVATLQKPCSGVFLNDNAEQKRDEFCVARTGKDHNATCWIDHTCLDVPPRPLTDNVWRLNDSDKPVIKRPRYKKRTSMQMLVAASGDAISSPSFSARRVKCKVRRKGEKEIGYRWETYRVTAATVEVEMKETVIPFMEEHKLDILDMDNAAVFTAQRNFLSANNIATTGFASLGIKRPDAGGHPPLSPDLCLQDAVIFPAFKREWRRRCPMNIPEGVRIATEIMSELSAKHVGRRYVDHYENLLTEIKNSKGGASHHMA